MWSSVPDRADPEHVARVLALAGRAVPRCGGVTVVAVDGPSGSGKTTLALAVARGLRCPVVHLDRIFPGWDGLAEAVGLVTTSVLEPLARGEQAAYRVWDWDHDRWDGTEVVPRSPVLVVEGCGSSVSPAGGYAAVRVWVEARPEERMRRGVARDGEVYRPHWERWAVQEEALFAADRTRERADLVLRTDGAAT
ncbi:MAG TPA: hypothetical protein VES95_11740 [Dermatophilaceae bacterium]|nr:hypothetical protein [Dermatophilaceae bacterium]